MAKFALGQAVSRVEDLALIQGRGRYADDVHLPNAAHAYVLRSPHAHARLLGIDATAARGAPGVLAVLTGADAQADGLGEFPCLIPVTNASVNPARSTGPALIAGGAYIAQLWLFWLAPILGAVVAGVIARWQHGEPDAL